MRITYITQTRFPTEKAHGHQIAHVCSALAGLGHQVTLVAPTVWNAIEDTPFEYYDLPENFEMVQMNHFDALKSKFVPGFLGFFVGMFFYRRALATYFKTHETDLIYIRSPFILSALPNIPIVLELHALSSRIRSLVVKNSQITKIVCLTSAMKQEVVSWGVDPSTVIVEPDAVDVSRFEHLPSKLEAKKKWGLPHNKAVIGYVGSLITQRTLEKGVELLLDASKYIQDEFVVWVVGGPLSQRIKLEHYANTKNIMHVRFTDQIPSKDVPSAIAACDICVYPVPRSDHAYFHRDTSPLKLFEYMASGVPVVSADTRPIRDIVSDNEVFFAKAGDHHDLARVLQHVLNNAEEAHEKAVRAKAVVTKHSWSERMKRIIAAL